MSRKKSLSKRLLDERRAQIDGAVKAKPDRSLVSAFDGFPWEEIAKVRDKAKKREEVR